MSEVIEYDADTLNTILADMEKLVKKTATLNKAAERLVEELDDLVNPEDPDAVKDGKGFRCEYEGCEDGPLYNAYSIHVHLVEEHEIDLNEIIIADWSDADENAYDTEHNKVLEAEAKKAEADKKAADKKKAAKKKTASKNKNKTPKKTETKKK